MITVPIPGSQALALEHLVLDYNGTVAKDGIILEGVRELLAQLFGSLSIHVITADTFGTVKQQFDGIEATLHLIDPDKQDLQKLSYIQKLGASKVVAIGNGRNDALMLENAALGIAIIGQEGAHAKTLLCADVAVTSIADALLLLLNPKRLIATLRN